jgi:hypothetical protein
VRGSGQVLVIENKDFVGEHEVLVDRLRKNNLEVTVRSSKPAGAMTKASPAGAGGCGAMAGVPAAAPPMRLAFVG